MSTKVEELNKKAQILCTKYNIQDCEDFIVFFRSNRDKYNTDKEAITEYNIIVKQYGSLINMLYTLKV